MVAVGPFIYAQAYSRGSQVGLPGAAFIAAGVVSILAEAVHQTLIGKLPPPAEKKTK